jgi:hypothetical protein
VTTGTPESGAPLDDPELLLDEALWLDAEPPELPLDPDVSLDAELALAPEVALDSLLLLPSAELAALVAPLPELPLDRELLPAVDAELVDDGPVPDEEGPLESSPLEPHAENVAAVATTAKQVRARITIFLPMGQGALGAVRPQPFRETLPHRRISLATWKIASTLAGRRRRCCWCRVVVLSSQHPGVPGDGRPRRSFNKMKRRPRFQRPEKFTGPPLRSGRPRRDPRAGTGQRPATTGCRSTDSELARIGDSPATVRPLGNVVIQSSKAVDRFA